ncbi:MAG TPA: DMT family transporter [Pseudosphingobacterium sp.]|nr:DMT family transporter [Pseudosphingobacterium sp.]
MFKYFFIVFAGACCFGVLSTFVKLAYNEGYHTSQIAFLQAFIGATSLWIIHYLQTVRINRPAIIVSFKNCYTLLLTGVAIGLTTYVYYRSVYYINASLAIVILMQFTWLGILIEWLCFKVKPQRSHIVLVFIILCGTLMAGGALDKGTQLLSLKGVALASLSSLLYAVYIVANSKVGKGLPTFYKSAVIMTGSALGIFAFNLGDLLYSNYFDSRLFKWTAFLALFGTIIPPILFAKGIPKIGVGLSTILMTAELPVAVISAYVFLHEDISFLQWFGVAWMLLAIIWMNLLNRRANNSIKQK